MTATATALREQARQYDRKALESFERCDTDGALSQWAHGINAQEARLQADIEENGGRAMFVALFDTAGNLVPAKKMDSKYDKHGIYFALLDDNGRITGEWFTPSKSQDARHARKADAAKGYYVGYVMAAAKAEIRGGNMFSCSAVAVRTDGGYSEDVEIVDNGQHDEFTFTLGRWYAVQGNLIF